ncbi:hypothetical protein J6590_099396 [Homalodisca vitripennis]|nr:hypothetical protein J6590_099396 [Homalodisca vitripennis]
MNFSELHINHSIARRQNWTVTIPPSTIVSQQCDSPLWVSKPSMFTEIETGIARLSYVVHIVCLRHVTEDPVA